MSATRSLLRSERFGELLLFALLVTCRPGLAAIQYRLTDLGTLGNGNSYATGINNSGQICGDVITDRPIPSVPLHSAFLYSNGVMHDMGSLGGGDTWSRAINNSGRVVGYSRDSTNLRAAYVYDGSMHALGSGARYATGINDAGTIVGAQPGFIYAQQQVQPLNITYPQDINSSGQIAVGSGAGAGAYLYDNGSLTRLVSAAYSSAFSLNDFGGIVGWFELDNNNRSLFHAFLHDGSFHDLGTLPGDLTSWGADINNEGQIVGWSSAGGGFISGYQRAFLVEGGQMQDLTTLLDTSGHGWSLGFTPSDSQWDGGTGVPNPNRFIAINDLGQIACTATNSLGQTHAVLLTPTPEPTGACTCLLLGATASLLRTRVKSDDRR